MANFKAGGQHLPPQQGQRWLAFRELKTVDMAKLPIAAELAMSGPA
jgi:hypothetical protein